MSRFIDRMDVKSFTTRTPDPPILRSRPPLAFLARDFAGVPDSSAASPLMVEMMCAPAPASGTTDSVFAAPDPPTTSTQGGSPDSFSAAAAHSTTLTAPRS